MTKTFLTKISYGMLRSNYGFLGLSLKVRAIRYIKLEYGKWSTLSFIFSSSWIGVLSINLNNNNDDNIPSPFQIDSLLIFLNILLHLALILFAFQLILMNHLAINLVQHLILDLHLNFQQHLIQFFTQLFLNDLHINWQLNT